MPELELEVAEGELRESGLEEMRGELKTIVSQLKEDDRRYPCLRILKRMSWLTFSTLSFFSNANHRTLSDLPLFGFKFVLQGKESLGMAMVFTLASHLREALTNYVQRKRKEADEEDDKRRNEEIEVSLSSFHHLHHQLQSITARLKHHLSISPAPLLSHQAEAEKFRGTAVTADRFKAWKVAYEAERAAAAKAAENEHLSKLSGKEREEYKRRAMKPTGKELFSKGQFKEEDDDEAEEGVQEVDWSLYSRENREGRSEREEEEALVTVSDDEE